MSYIGNEPIVSATRTITEVTATAGQTVFVANGGYTVGYIDVFLNGAQLQTVDFTATNGSSITLTEAAQVGDVLKLVAWGTFLASSALTANNPSYTGTLTGGTGVVNIGSGQLYKDASGRVGVGTSSPTYKITSVYSGSSTAVTDYAFVGGSETYQMIGLSEDTANNAIAITNKYSSGGNILFRTGTGGTISEAMRIDSSRNLLVGCTALPDSTISGFGANGNAWSVSSTSATLTNYFHRSYTSGSRFAAAFYVNTTLVGNISNNSTSTSYNTSSDYRLKENIAPMTGALAKLSALKPCTYTWKVDGSFGEGFIAHEIAEVVPQAVTGEKDAVDAEGNPVYQGIDTSFLVATLTAAIQEQQAQLTDMSLTLANANAIITEQSLALTDLKSRIETLESK